jgi:hypothetical protein
MMDPLRPMIIEHLVSRVENGTMALVSTAQPPKLVQRRSTCGQSNSKMSSILQQQDCDSPGSESE